jgi:uncharacterized membrane protein
MLLNAMDHFIEDFRALRTGTRRLLAGGFVLASASLYLGFAIFLVALRSVGDHLRDELLGFFLVVLWMLINSGIATVMTRTGARWLKRFCWSSIVTVLGAIIAFAVVAARAAVLHLA